MNTIPITQRGITMIEVMVTIFILSVGLLAMARMQMNSLKYSRSAYYHSVATQQAQDMADRMRANMFSVLKGEYDNLAGIPTSSKDCNDSATICTPTDLQVFDLYEWNTGNANRLPDGVGRVQVDAGGSIYRISIGWNDLEEAKTYIMDVHP